MIAILVCGVVAVVAAVVVFRLIGDPTEKLGPWMGEQIDKDRTLAQECDH